MLFDWFTGKMPRRKKAVLVSCQETEWKEDDFPETQLLQEVSPGSAAAEADGSLQDETLLAPAVSVQKCPKAYVIETASGKRFSITQAHFVMGRYSEKGTTQADLCVADPMISRRHAEIFYTDEGFWIQDLDSLNGTFLSGTRLSPNVPHRLENQMSFRLYQTDYRFEHE